MTTHVAYTLLPEEMTSQQRAQANYRLKHGPRRGGKPGKHVASRALFDQAQFIAIDGEGWDVGPEQTTSINRAGRDAMHLRSRAHHYTLLAASTGETLIAEPGKRLATRACLDFLCDVQRAHHPCILVAFASGYDVNHMLMHGLTRDTLYSLSQGRRVTLRFGTDSYLLEYRARKSLAIKRNTERSVTLWDVWGFFQASFVEVIGKWLGKDSKHYASIKAMKAKRDSFTPDQMAEIIAYNVTELECLVAVMNKLRQAIAALGLKIARWDGAGAVAAAMYQLHATKDAKGSSSAPAYIAACHAFSGGHIEIFQLGHYNGSVYHYDINSAYPSVIADLPDLASGRWKQRDAVLPDTGSFTLVRIRWHLESGMSFYPLFYRTSWGSIIYPATGEGWYWMPEYKAAQHYVSCYGGDMEVLEAWEFIPTSNNKPFAFVQQYYTQRQEYINATHTPENEWKLGAEKIIKLGLNSLYGKMAQQIGARDGNPPPYFQIEWAGYVTAATRAKLMMAACQDMPSIISVATDGIFSTQPLDLPTPEKKELGKWEFQKHDGMTVVSAGVYWLHEGDGRLKHYSRGFDKDAMTTYDFLIKAWRSGDSAVAVPLKRLIGIGTACASPIAWQLRGRFVRCERILGVRSGDSKRAPLMSKHKPHLGFVHTTPNHNNDFNHLEYPSAIYTIDWNPVLPDLQTDFTVTEAMEELDYLEA